MKSLIILCTLFFFVVGCADDFNTLNTNPKAYNSAPGDALFANAQRRLTRFMTSADQNTNVYRLYAQYWAQCTYPEESQYDITRSIPKNAWIFLYRETLKDLKEAEGIIAAGRDVTNEKQVDNELAMIKVVRTYAYHVLVDLFGNVPYEEALDGENITPAYTDARTIYDSISSDLDDAISTLSANVAEKSFDSTQDLFYGGDVAKWIKFANSLKLRLALRYADVDAAKAKTMVEEASANVFASNADNCNVTFFTASPNKNPLYETLVDSGRQDFVPANTIVDMMNSLNDPRRTKYFQSNITTPTSATDTTTVVLFVGGIYGTNNTYTNFSSLSSYFFKNPDFPGTLMTYAEVEFLLAEAVERGFLLGETTAEEYYNKGVEASILQWGGTEAEYDAYIAQPDVAYATAVSATATWQQKIAVQKWLALFNDGFEGWCTWRKFDYPTFNPPSGLTLADIPTRMVYPQAEPQLNGSNYRAASTAIGGDKLTTKIFWDVK